MIARRTLLHTLALGACLAALPGAIAAQAKGTAKPAAKKTATAPATTTAGASAGATTAAMPSARQVIDAYVKAIGGRDAVVARKSVRSTATLEVPAAGMKADIESSVMAPNKLVVKTTMPGLGELMQGFDGTTAWAIDPMQGARILVGAELEQMKAQADFMAELRESSNFKQMNVVADTSFEGRPAWKLHLVRNSGEEVREYYDKETSLLLGTQTTVQTQMGPIEATTLRQDYKQMGGVIVPTKSIQRANGQEFLITILTSEADAVDPSVFELPAQIKALVPAPAK